MRFKRIKSKDKQMTYIDADYIEYTISVKCLQQTVHYVFWKYLNHCQNSLKILMIKGFHFLHFRDILSYFVNNICYDNQLSNETDKYHKNAGNKKIMIATKHS